uniref:Uncharacterized protein n=1 Tax=Anguilla anguilla TaxID=7936 RepID=A0A0E9T5L7_ANGAN
MEFHWYWRRLPKFWYIDISIFRSVQTLCTLVLMVRMWTIFNRH